MGLFDRVKDLFGGSGSGDEAVVERPVDVEARKSQLTELEDALRTLARAMTSRDDLMTNPGWRGRVDDLRFAANEASRLSGSGFDRTALLDLAAEVRPLYRGTNVPAEYAPYVDEHERVVNAAAALREPLPSETVPPDAT